MIRLVRRAWALPATLLGLALGAIAVVLGATVHRVDGTLEIAGGAMAWIPLPFSAITLGHVILAVDDAARVRCRAHERVHVAQYERWGIAFFPAYLASSAWQLARGGDAYRDNRFEREAFSRSDPPGGV
ncbi:MAG TPA: hypothetical protein VGI14_21430 [Casimicrobiaceae bacterium]